MNETWKDIEGYEGYYQVSNLGRVKSFRKSSKMHKQDEYILTPTVANNSYAQVTLYRNSTRKKFLVHRLVAIAFIPNPNNLPYINHKDENPLNNSCDNLEWCTAFYNNNYGTARIRMVDSKSKPIEQLTLDNKLIAIYRSAKIASELLGINHKYLNQCCNEKIATNGYLWRYSDFKF